MANDVENTSSKVYRLLSDRCSLRVESAANPLRCCLSWRRACEVRRGGPAGRVRGHRMTGGTPKEVHWTAEQQKRPQRTYRGRKRRETAAKGSTTGRCFRPQNVVFVNPPKDSPELFLVHLLVLEFSFVPKRNSTMNDKRFDRAFANPTTRLRWYTRPRKRGKSGVRQEL